MKKRFFAMLFCLVMLATFLPATVYAAGETVYIDAITITGLEQPYGGDPMDETYTVKETEYMEGTGVIWFDINKNKYVYEDYITGHQYYDRVWVNLKAGYAFSSNARAKVNGQWVTPLNNYGNGMEVKITFDPCVEKPHTHTPSKWKTDEDSHYKVCTGCGEELERADHKGGKATCAKKGKCSVCGYAYIAKTKEHTPGPAATEKNPQKCTVCGDILAPALTPGHTHSLTLVEKVAPTCTQPGKEAYYTCGGCDQIFSDDAGKKAISKDKDLTIAPLGHKVSENWEFDENSHWQTCSVCNSKLEETGAEHNLQAEKCAVCDYDNTAPTETTAVPTTPEPQPQKSEKGGLPWWGFLLIGVGVAGAGVGGFLVLKKRK